MENMNSNPNATSTTASTSLTVQNQLNAQVDNKTSATTSNEHNTANGSEKFEFTELFKELGNHHGFSYGMWHIDLPYILYDSQEGLHCYANSEQVEKSGIYTCHTGQPVKTSNNQAPTLDMSITSLVCYQWIAIIILLVFFRSARKKYKKNPNKAPSGIQNMIESVFMFIRDDMVFPNIPNKQLAMKLMPYFSALFFFILAMNLIGLIPGSHAATGAIGVTAALAITAFLVINITSISQIGIGNYLKHLLGGAPWWMFFIMIPIEILSMFIKPFALTIRLFANMTAGHVVLLTLVGLIFFFHTVIVSPVSIGFSVFIYALELLVAFLQAYIFTTLTVIFVSLGLGEHSHEETMEHAH